MRRISSSRPTPARQFQYEGELVAVFGKRARNVTRENALDYVFGWTIGNDVSERGWQKDDRTLWRAKNADTFKPMGPWIVTGLDPAKHGDGRSASTARKPTASPPTT